MFSALSRVVSPFTSFCRVWRLIWLDEGFFLLWERISILYERTFLLFVMAMCIMLDYFSHSWYFYLRIFEMGFPLMSIRQEDMDLT